MTRLNLIVAIMAGLATFGYGHGLRISAQGLRLSRNFYTVDPGKLYRSAQLTPAELQEAIRMYGIKTVINLRGNRHGYSWYDEEVKTARAAKVKLIDISFTTESIPPRGELISLLDAYENAPRPILIHCQSGSDRTGEAAAIYAMDYMHESREQALEMLSYRYLHVPLFVPAKKYFVSIYGGEKWARQSYNQCDKNFLFADRRSCASSSLRTPASSN